MLENLETYFLGQRVLTGKLISLKTKSTRMETIFNDPTQRNCCLYIPPGHLIAKGASSLPLILDLAPYTNSGQGRVAWKNFSLNVPQRVESLILSGKIPPVVVAFPDTFNCLGGSQFVNSPILGQVSDFLHLELVPLIEKKFFCGGHGKRYILGKSSGGFGALHSVVNYPDFWTGAACHSGDMGFECAFTPDFATASMILEPFGYNICDFLSAFWQQENPKGEWIMTLMMLALSASYAPGDPKKIPYGIELPVDLKTLKIKKDLFDQWLSFDPLYYSEHAFDALKSLKKLYLDCGRYDPYRLQFGARRVHEHLCCADVPHVYQEFDGTHSGIDHRLEVSLPFLLSSSV